MDLIAHIASDPIMRQLAEGIARPGRVHARSSHGSSTAFIAAALARLSKRQVVLVVAHLDEADETVDELSAHGVNALRFPAMEVLPGESSVSIDLFAERLSVLRRVMEAPGGGGSAGTASRPMPDVLVCPIAALMQPVPNASSLGALARTLRVQEQLDPLKLVRWLSEAGYERVETIEEPGQFAVRGGIVDVFPPGDARTPSGAVSFASSASGVPVRLDFFGDTIDRISEIDLDTMGSDRALREVELVCASLERVLAPSPPSVAPGASTRAVAVQKGAAALDATGGPSSVSFIEYLSRSSVAILHEPMELTEQARGYFERLTDPRIYGPPAVFKGVHERFTSIVEIAQFSLAGIASELVLELPVGPLGSLPRDAGDALRELAALTTTDAAPGGERGRVALFCQNSGELTRLNELIAECVPGASERLGASVGYVHRGFVWGGGDEGGERGGVHQETLHVVPYHEMLHRFETRRRIGASRVGNSGASAEQRIKAGRAIDTFLDFAPGDFVVHRDHGISKFHGLTTMRPHEVKREGPVVLPGDRPRKKPRSVNAKGERGAPTVEDDPDEGLEEYLLLEFASKTRLYVPASKIDQVQKYVGGFRGEPKLSTLGGTRWKKQKEGVSESVKDLASELLRVRAARGHLPGVSFPSDTPWQKEFEAEFPFQETEDQLAAIGEIKRDMARERPMDRLLCGDVGYGKTEVAIRAAFKAVEFGKQVAVLVPTTVLAEQHEQTFRSRLADYPFKVESLSRFKTTKEINDTLMSVRKGQVDVVIGTHRLLSKDVKFNDLGLVVIDEEQRFGVEHKERLLALRLTVDVLTLSATPIPRTLHMSMLGLRDISSLTTAPMDRRAVVTEVIPYNPRRIEQALKRELARDGQVFFVHNRVHNIQSVADDIQRLVPDAKILIGHGQMPDGELEEVMLRFMRREADILVSTTIIESGIDIPTANTMFINDADRFGLAELHQLRGRVGRYKHRAYCYMLLNPERVTTEKAVKRLKAIEEFSMLGAGFKIAMRDLEIRGAGNILGPEQSGHIAAVGYEMYCQLLERAVKELNDEPTNVASETSVEIGVTGLIPKRYIPSDQRRMEAYRRIAIAQTPAELERIESEIAQAYGQSRPPATERLLELAQLRVAASLLKIRSIAIREKDVLIRALPEDAARVALVLKASAQASVTLLPPPTGEKLSEVYFRPPAAYLEPGTLLRVLRTLLSAGVA